MVQAQRRRQPHAKLDILASRLALKVDKHAGGRHGLHTGRLGGVRHGQRLQLVLVHGEECQHWHKVGRRIFLDGAGDKLEEQPHEPVPPGPQPPRLHSCGQLADHGREGDKLEEDEEDEVGGEISEEVGKDLGRYLPTLAHLHHVDEEQDQLLLQRGTLACITSQNIIIVDYKWYRYFSKAEFSQYDLFSKYRSYTDRSTIPGTWALLEKLMKVTELPISKELLYRTHEVFKFNI